MRVCFSMLFIISLTLWLAGCGLPSNSPVSPALAASARNETTLIVFAAASLTEAFTEMAARFEADHPNVTVLLNFAGSNSLRLQLEQGARTDVFASADTTHMDTLFRATMVDQPVVFAYNRLVVIVPADNPASVGSLGDLTKPGLKLVLAGPEVPAGRYARQSLAQLNANPLLGPDFTDRVLGNLVSEEETVKAVVTKLLLGEADAGIVYTSDVTPAVADKLSTIAIPAEYNIVAEYPIALAADSARPELGQQFIDFVLSARGQVIMANHGFQPLLPGPNH